MLCGLYYLKGLFSRGNRNGSSDGVDDTSQHALGNQHHSARPPPGKDDDRQANPYAELSEVACSPPDENQGERRLYQRHYYGDRDSM